MPLYDVKCLTCGCEFETFCKIRDRKEVTCECGGHTEILITGTNRDWFRPYLDPDFGIEPVEVRSKGHLKELCLKHNVTSHSLGDIRNITEI